MRSVAVLGATGSIGTQALEIVGANPALRACALAAGSDHAGLIALARAHGVERIALVDSEAAAGARADFAGEVLEGPDGVERLVADSGADVVLNAIVGAAGLRATLATLAAGADLALANKESLVAGGGLVMDALRRSGRSMLPVDSEHSALAQCLAGAAEGSVSGLVITASGGPFRGRTAESLADVTVADALAHPTWNMGAKITIDSSTLMNKGLEVIEAHELFGVDYDHVAVVVHPQSVVHGMVEFTDGATIAQLSMPDMRLPIGLALGAPDRLDEAFGPLDWTTLGALTFEPPDLGTFRALQLAYDAGRAGGTAPAVLNGANEVAVAAFLERRVPWSAIAEVVEETLQGGAGNADELSDVLEADRVARARAGAVVERRTAA